MAQPPRSADPRHRDACRAGPPPAATDAGDARLPRLSGSQAEGVANRVSGWSANGRVGVRIALAERQALAVMDHPDIARFHDGGATERGRPCFVMELVRGLPITDDCNKNRLRTDERIRLFADVCNAVQHAHHKGVIHRDLKPGNVLVTVKDNKPIAKIIDPGIAKALGQDLTDRTLVTRLGQIIGTPA